MSVKKKKDSKRKFLLANNVSNEAEGTRTLNLRIFSPMFAFVSACGIRVKGCRIETYETNGKPE